MLKRLKNKDLLGLSDITKEEIRLILDHAKTMKQIIKSGVKKTADLQGKSVITLFYENSTRTRLSFELASKYMGAAAANISASTSSVSKGETLVDTGRTIAATSTDVIIIRHPMSGAPHLMAKNVAASVINAGDGMNEHPTQALLDMYTIEDKKGKLDGVEVAITGDALHSRVARSNIWGLSKMGANIRIFAPSTLLPKEIEKMGVKVCKTLSEAVEGADAVMGLRLQLERQKRALFPTEREYSKYFCIDEKIFSLAKKDALLMHPGPVNRGLELSSALIDCPSSFIDEQVTNGVAVRMALLDLLCNSKKFAY